MFAYNWEHEKCPLYRVASVRYSGVSNVLKSMEKHSELVLILWVSAVEGCPLLKGICSIVVKVLLVCE